MLPQAIRIKFSKVGSLQFISHLDLDRTMKTVMVRAKIPIHYSEGFNPHPKMVFSMPLSIGTESICEYLDIKIDRELLSEEIISRLNAALPAEMRVLEVYEPKTKLSEIKYAEYEILTEEYIDFNIFENACITVMKRTKSGIKETDIKPLIKRAQGIDGGIKCVLATESSAYLNPEYVARALGLNCYTIMKTRTLFSDGETEFK